VRFPLFAGRAKRIFALPSPNPDRLLVEEFEFSVAR